MTDSIRPLRVAVLVSVGRHPVSGAPRWSRNDARALSLAFALPPSLTSIEVIHAGNAQHAALADYLALGVKALNVVSVAPDINIVPALLARVHHADLIICGSRAEGQEDSGMVPYLLANALDMNLVPSVLDLTIAQDRAVAEQFLPKGRRRSVEVGLPTVVTVHPLAPLTVRYAYAQKLAGRIIAAPAQAPAIAGTDWTVEAIRAKPIKLAAREKRSGHTRMLSATTTESRAGQVMSQGSTQEKAAAVITYLREHGLIDY